MDIRNFFGPIKQGKKKASFSGDDDDFAEKPTKTDRKKKKKGIIFDSDSSDEDPLPRKTKKKLESSSSDIIGASDDETSVKSKKKMKKSTVSSSKRQQKKSEPKKMKEITPDNFFGASSKTVRKEQRLNKRKASDDTPERKPEVITIDDDIDFDGSLSMTPKKKVKREVKVEKSEKTISSKLSDMTKQQESKSSKRQTRRETSTSKTPEKSRSKNSTVPMVKDEPVSRPSQKPTENNIKSKTVNTPKKVEPLKEKKTNKQITPEKPKQVEETKIEENQGSSKKERYVKYMQWQNRGGAKAPGSKEIPQGADNCLEGLTFVITGILESLERDDAKSLIERYGGKVTGNVSGRTSYVIIGDDPGEAKIKKAEQHKTKQLDEDGLLELIKNKPGKKSKYEIAAEKEADEEEQKKAEDAKIEKEKKATPKKTEAENKSTASPIVEDTKTRTKSKSSMSPLTPGSDSQGSISSLPDSQKLVASSDSNAEYLLWVDKYKPKGLKQIIGQQGAKSNVEKLKAWLQDWQKNNRHQDGSKPKPKPKVNMWGGGGDPTGAGFKAALLSGPPGVGKTTAATLVCQELGFEFIEMNASDTRSKRTLKEEVSQMLDNTSISNMFGSEEKKKTAASGTRNALIMDEIDGMAGNEDRGGMAEVIQLIKTTKMPIICMCNDRSSPKMRSLTNHCFDLRFQRPRVEQITGAMMSICFKEGLKIPAPALQALIKGCNQDIRQVLYNLSMLKASNKSVSYDEAKKHADDAHKDVSIGIFDIARKLLTSESTSLSINDKMSLFFMDYSMIPLFIQDNYPNIRPGNTGGNIHKHLSALSKTADSIALADRVDRLIRSDQAWGALPTLGLLSTVVPCEIMRGGMSGMINFPSFFGKLSSTGKNHRLLQELKFHSSLETGGANETTFNLDYLPYMRCHLTQPLINQSQTGDTELHKTSQLLDAYDLLREDFDSIVEIGQFPGKPQPMSKVDTKVKSAFTRTFNKENHKTPYAVQSAPKKGKKGTVTEDMGYGLEGESQTIDDEEEEEDLDAMVKAKPARKKSTASTSKAGKSATGKRGKKK
ncbi:replication factor C subunit 1-like [Styela clava]